MDSKKLLRRSYEKKFEKIRELYNIEKPSQGWIKTLREFFGMTTTQLAKRLNVAQPRIVNMEKNENNLKLSTLEKIADAFNCKFIYMFVPKQSLDEILYNQAKKKAIKILNKVNQNMALENQQTDTDEILEDLIKELLKNNLTRIWDEANKE